jgi:hypothetical protein
VGSRARSRGPLIAAAWALAVLGIAIVGIGGRLGDTDARTGLTASASIPAEVVATPAPSPTGPVVALSEPAPPPAAVTGIPLWVRGRVGSDVHEVVVVLRTGGAEVARQTTRPGRSGRFAAVFTLQPPRPRMNLTVVAIAQDAAAQPLGEARQEVRVAPLARVAALPSPRPSLGEDGVLGSRGVDLAPVVAALDEPFGWTWRPEGGLATYR